MPLLNARFTQLAIFCLAAQSLFPGDSSVQAAVINRQPAGENVARHLEKTTDRDDGGLHHSQALFSYPRSHGTGGGGNQGQDIKVRRRSQKERSHKSISLSDGHGTKYMINNRRQATTPQWVSTPRNETFFNSTASASNTPDGIPGTVGIVSHTTNSDNVLLAYLLLVRNEDGRYVLDASDKNMTEIFLRNASSPSLRGDDVYPVELTIPIDNRLLYCATYDQEASTAEPLTAQKCLGDEGRAAHQNQVFSYNSSSGIIRPTWFTGRAVDGGDVTPSPSSSASGFGAADWGATPSSDSPLASASSASWSRRDDSSHPVQNVTLVWFPKRGPANKLAANPPSASTSTVTQTVTVYSGVATSSSIYAAAAAASTPSTSASSVPAAVAPGVTGLSVEIVGGGFSSSSSPSSYGMAAASGSASMSPSAAYSPRASMNAAAIAESVVVSYSPSQSASAASPSGVLGAAAVSPSGNSARMSSTAAASGASAAAYVAGVFERYAEVTPVSTEPYSWRFKVDPAR